MVADDNRIVPALQVIDFISQKNKISFTSKQERKKQITSLSFTLQTRIYAVTFGLCAIYRKASTIARLREQNHATDDVQLVLVTFGTIDFCIGKVAVLKFQWVNTLQRSNILSNILLFQSFSLYISATIAFDSISFMN